MSGFLRVVGAIGFIGSILGWIALGNQVGFWSTFPVALSGMVGGVLLAGFGSVLDDLKAIRIEAVKQTGILRDMTAPTAASPYQPSRTEPELGRLNFKLGDR